MNMPTSRVSISIVALDMGEPLSKCRAVTEKFHVAIVLP